jgi:hypothetical protein
MHRQPTAPVGWFQISFHSSVYVDELHICASALGPDADPPEVLALEEAHWLSSRMLFYSALLGHIYYYLTFEQC